MRTVPLLRARSRAAPGGARRRHVVLLLALALAASLAVHRRVAQLERAQVSVASTLASPACARGVAPADVPRHCCDGVFVCGAGLAPQGDAAAGRRIEPGGGGATQPATIPCSAVNDDYCDCPDGSDEPGTAACSHVQSAAGFVCGDGARVPASRVGDGVADCAGGEDEG